MNASFAAAEVLLQHWPGHMWGNGMGGWWGFGMIFGWLFWLVLLVLAVLLVWRLARGHPLTGGTPHAHETPLDILKKRYARGEIDKEEFEAKKRDLGY